MANATEAVEHNKLPILTVEAFANGANGCVLTAWDTWVKNKDIRSPKTLVAIVPGDKKEQAKLLGFDVDSRLSVQNLVFLNPDSQEGTPQRYFSRTVTCYQPCR